MNETLTVSEQPLDPAEDNPYYLLMTVFGVAKDKATIRKNRDAWNGWMLQGHRKSPIESKPLPRIDAGKLQEIKSAFLVRKGRRQVEIPRPGSTFSAHRTAFRDPLSLDGYWFPAIDLKSCQFFAAVSLREIFVLGTTEISNKCIFHDRARFSRARFLEETHFHATFSGDASFHGAIFDEKAKFDGTRFGSTKNVDFGEALFDSNASFIDVRFETSAIFKEAKFSDRAIFDLSQFNQSALFQRSSFSYGVSFSKVKFNGDADFSNATFAGSTLFAGAIFALIPPAFYEAKMHDSTLWPSRQAWPRLIPGRLGPAEVVSRYACLKRQMEAQKRQNDELDFFCLELAARRNTLGAFHPRSAMIGLYGLLSDYGRSVGRPLVAFGLLTFVGAALIARDKNVADWPLEKLVGLSFANMLGPFGLRKDLLEVDFDTLSAATLALCGAQSIFGLGLLFLAGLGLRNMFRLKS